MRVFLKIAYFNYYLSTPRTDKHTNELEVDSAFPKFTGESTFTNS